MKLFISYGHDHNRDFVHRIRDDLARHGHDAKLDDARAQYQASFSTRERLVASDPTNAAWQRDLSASLIKITAALLQSGDRPAACPMARRVEAQAEHMAPRFPQDPERDYRLLAADRLVVLACGASA